jgi:tripartite-type tricarboxylate transporter receptor subunit TctC
MTKRSRRRTGRPFGGKRMRSVAAGHAPPAAAQSYPSRPIKVVIPASAGGTQDVFMRALGEDLRRRLGQTLVIENRPAGNFNIGARACADSAPDGYTICMLPNEALVYNQLLHGCVAYHPKSYTAQNPGNARFIAVQRASLGFVDIR